MTSVRIENSTVREKCNPSGGGGTAFKLTIGTKQCSIERSVFFGAISRLSFRSCSNLFGSPAETRENLGRTDRNPVFAPLFNGPEGNVMNAQNGIVRTPKFLLCASKGCSFVETGIFGHGPQLLKTSRIRPRPQGPRSGTTQAAAVHPSIAGLNHS